MQTMCEGWGVLAAAGDIDASLAPELQRLVSTALHHSGWRLIVDMRGVGFLDSTGIGIITEAAKGARANGGDLRLVRPQPLISRVLEITGLDRVISCHASVAEAAAAPLPAD